MALQAWHEIAYLSFNSKQPENSLGPLANLADYDWSIGSYKLVARLLVIIGKISMFPEGGMSQMRYHNSLTSKQSMLFIIAH